MICLDNTDTLEGGASVNAVVDYTVHGLVGTTFTNIAQGQLSNTNPSVLYTAGAAISIVSVIYVNTHSAAVTVDLYLDPANAGTPRRLIPKALTLGIGYSLHFDGQRCSILDASGAIIFGVNVSDTAFAVGWDGVTTIAPSKNAVWDALGTAASPTFTGETLSGLTASLSVFTGASKELVSKTDANLAILVGNLLFPVGSIYTAVVSTNPGTLLGFGTWTAFGAGRVLVGISAETEFDVVEETGGAKTHTLAAGELAVHYHGPPVGFSTLLGNTGVASVASGSVVGVQETSLTGAASVAGGGAHNNLQPYIVVYMWKRTA